MGDRLQAGKSCIVTATEVDSAFYPPWDYKMTATEMTLVLATQLLKNNN